MKNYIKSIIITLTVSTMTLILISCAANVQQTSPNSANNEVEKTVTYEEYTAIDPSTSTSVTESTEDVSIANLLLSPNLVASYEKLISQVIESIKSLGSGEGCDGGQCSGGGCGGNNQASKKSPPNEDELNKRYDPDNDTHALPGPEESEEETDNNSKRGSGGDDDDSTFDDLHDPLNRTKETLSMLQIKIDEPLLET